MRTVYKLTASVKCGGEICVAYVLLMLADSLWLRIEKQYRPTVQHTLPKPKDRGALVAAEIFMGITKSGDTCTSNSFLLSCIENEWQLTQCFVWRNAGTGSHGCHLWIYRKSTLYWKLTSRQQKSKTNIVSNYILQ